MFDDIIKLKPEPLIDPECPWIEGSTVQVIVVLITEYVTIY